MTVELTKQVDGLALQRARFTLCHLGNGHIEVQIVIHRDDQPTDSVQTMTVDETGTANAHVYRTLVAHFTAFTPEELAGAEVTWHMVTHADTSQEARDLGEMIAAAVMEDLAAPIEAFEQNLLADDDDATPLA